MKQMNQEQTMLQNMLIVMICKFAPDARKVVITIAECAQLAKDFGAPEKVAALLQTFDNGVLTLEVVPQEEAILRLGEQAQAAQAANEATDVVRH